MVTIPIKIAREFEIKPGCKLDWQPVEGKEQIKVAVIPDRATLATQLFGAGKQFSPDRDPVADLITEREAEG